jgi:hypothetical protein
MLCSLSNNWPCGILSEPAPRPVLPCLLTHAWDDGRWRHLADSQASRIHCGAKVNRRPTKKQILLPKTTTQQTPKKTCEPGGGPGITARVSRGCRCGHTPTIGHPAPSRQSCRRPGGWPNWHPNLMQTSACRHRMEAADVCPDRPPAACDLGWSNGQPPPLVQLAPSGHSAGRVGG